MQKLQSVESHSGGEPLPSLRELDSVPGEKEVEETTHAIRRLNMLFIIAFTDTAYSIIYNSGLHIICSVAF